MKVLYSPERKVKSESCFSTRNFYFFNYVFYLKATACFSKQTGIHFSQEVEFKCFGNEIG